MGDGYRDLDVLIRGRRRAEAAAEIRRRLWTAPADPELIARLAITHVLASESGLALDRARQAIALGPGCARAWFALGYALQARADADGAAWAYERSIAVDPAPATAHNLAVIHLRRGDARRAEDVLRQQLTVTPRDPSVLDALASALGAQRRRRERARILWQRFRAHPGARQLEDLIDDLHLIGLSWALLVVTTILVFVAVAAGHRWMVSAAWPYVTTYVIFTVGAVALLAGQLHRLGTRHPVTVSRILWATAAALFFGYSLWQGFAG